MEGCLGVGKLGRGRKCARVELQAAVLCVVCHPLQGDVGERESAWIGSITAAHIAMHAGEPHLGEALSGRRGRGPEGGLKLESFFIDGQRLNGVQDVRVQAGIEEAVLDNIDAAEDGGNPQRLYAEPVP